MRFTRIVDSRLYGYECTRDNRKAEVVRSYSDNWNAFLYEDNVMVNPYRQQEIAARVAARMLDEPVKVPPEHVTEKEARRIARAFLRKEV